jgi:protoporphyrinogen oxidase
MYESMARAIEQSGGKVLLNARVTGIKMEQRKIVSVSFEDNTGVKTELEAEHFITSLPLRDLLNLLTPIDEQDVVQAGNLLKYRDFLSVNLALNANFLFPDNWIYIHSPEVKLGRVQNFKQWSPAMIPEEGCSSLGLEYFCNEGDELWSAPDKDLIRMATEEISRLRLIKPNFVKWGKVMRVPKAYPVYDDDYQKAMPTVVAFINSLENLQTIGRNGLHRYNNMDHSILTGLLAAKNIEGANFDLWQVNTEEEYHEKVKN